MHVRKRMRDEVKNNDADEIINKSVHACIEVQNCMFMGWTQDVRMLEPVKVDKEIQINDWCAEYLEKQVNLRGYEKVKNSNDICCIFGKSRPNTFYNLSNSGLEIIFS